MLLNEHEEMKRRSKELLEFYHQKARGWEPDEVADLTEAAALDWLFSLTETLDIWREKADGVMTDGEVILGYANLGILLEGWLTLYLTVYLEDFRKDGKKNLPSQLTLERLIQFMRKNVWKDGKEKQQWIAWMDGIRKKRNAVHAFQYRNIGTNKELKADIEKYDKFIVDQMSAPLYKNGDFITDYTE